ncbi:Tetratricopeptide repeat [uncultured virus]|nr:Tetratricopeptide repeat [uncultured virus]
MENSLEIELVIANEKLPDFINSFTKCMICYNNLNKAKETSCCHNLYCELCVNVWKSKINSTCPYCRSKNTEYKDNIPIQRMADQIPMTCCYKINGCSNCPAFKDYSIHIKKCEFKNIVIIPKASTIENQIKNALETMNQNKINGKKILDSIKPNDPETVIMLDLVNAHYLYLNNNFTEALKNYQKILTQVLTSHGENHLHVINCYAGKALILKKLGKYKEAIENYTKAILLTKNNGNNTNELNSYLIQLADLKRKNDDLDGSEMDYRNVLSNIILENDKVSVNRGLGLIYKKRCNFDKALDHFDECSKILEKHNCKLRDLGITYLDIGDIYRKREQHESAINFYEKAIDHISSTVEHDNIEAVDVFYYMSLSLTSLEKIDESNFYLEKAKTIMDKIKTLHYKNGMILVAFGLNKSLKKNYDEAHKDFKNAIKILTETSGEDHIEVADAHINLVESYIKQQHENQNLDNNNELKNYVELAKNIYEKKKLDPKHPKILKCESLFLILEIIFSKN